VFVFELFCSRSLTQATEHKNISRTVCKQQSHRACNLTQLGAYPKPAQIGRSVQTASGINGRRGTGDPNDSAFRWTVSVHASISLTTFKQNQKYGRILTTVGRGWCCPRPRCPAWWGPSTEQSQDSSTM